MSGFDVVILSANAANAVACVESVLANEPELVPADVIVVDDGARAAAEGRLPGVRWIDGVKPFVFARNANRGLAASSRDVVLLNDDAPLLTHRGLSHLAAAAHAHPHAGIVSAAVRGTVRNLNQHERTAGRLRAEPRDLCFICVYLRRELIDRIGPLDERFVGYGYEDNDYCDRARAAGFTLLVCADCVVDHSGTLRPTFRSRRDFAQLVLQNRRLYVEKQAETSDFLCALRTHNDGAHVGEVLESALRLCRRAFVLDAHSDDGTAAICRSFGARVVLLDPPSAGADAMRDKNHLLRAVGAASPDWVLWLDGGDVLERSGPAAIRAAAAVAGSTSAFTLRLSCLWEEPDRVRTDGIFGQLRRPSLFRLRGVRPERLFFPPAPRAEWQRGNVPCGLRGITRHLDVRLKHYGGLEWLDEAQRAPGPPRFERWSE